MATTAAWMPTRNDRQMQFACCRPPRSYHGGPSLQSPSISVECVPGLLHQRSLQFCVELVIPKLESTVPLVHELDPRRMVEDATLTYTANIPGVTISFSRTWEEVNSWMCSSCHRIQFPVSQQNSKSGWRMLVALAVGVRIALVGAFAGVKGADPGRGQ